MRKERDAVMNSNELTVVSERLKKAFVEKFPNPESHPRRMIRAAEWLTEQARWHSELRLILNRAYRRNACDEIVHLASWMLSNPQALKSMGNKNDD